jgi:hypothetical protein
MIASHKRTNGNNGVNLLYRNGCLSMTPFPYGLSRTSIHKRRRLLPSDLARNVNCGGFLDTCRHCGIQIFRKAQSRPRICLQCEKKRATPIHDRCKDCQEPIIRSNVRKARICQKCKKSREKLHGTSQAFHGHVASLPLLHTVDETSRTCFSSPHLPFFQPFLPQSNFRRFNAVHRWFQLMSQQMSYYQRQQVTASALQEPLPCSSFVPSFYSSPMHPYSSYNPLSSFPLDTLQEASGICDTNECSSESFHDLSSKDPPISFLPKLNTKHFNCPEDIVLYLQKKILDALCTKSEKQEGNAALVCSETTRIPSPTPCINFSHTAYDSKKPLKECLSNEPILIPQVNPYQITFGVSETCQTSSGHSGIIAEMDSSTFPTDDDNNLQEKQTVEKTNPSVSLLDETHGNFFNTYVRQAEDNQSESCSSTTCHDSSRTSTSLTNELSSPFGFQEASIDTAVWQQQQQQKQQEQQLEQEEQQEGICSDHSYTITLSPNEMNEEETMSPFLLSSTHTIQPNTLSKNDTMLTHSSVLPENTYNPLKQLCHFSNTDSHDLFSPNTFL